jgi:hypothetical protein
VCYCICQPKGHNRILIKPISHRENRLGDIFGVNLNVTIPGQEINLGEQMGSR